MSTSSYPGYNPFCRRMWSAGSCLTMRRDPAADDTSDRMRVVFSMRRLMILSLWQFFVLTWGFSFSRFGEHGIHYGNGVPGFTVEWVFAPDACYAGMLRWNPTHWKLAYYFGFELESWDYLLRTSGAEWPHWTGFSGIVSGRDIIFRVPWWFLFVVSLGAVTVTADCARRVARRIHAATACPQESDSPQPTIDYARRDPWLDRKRRLLRRAVMASVISTAVMSLDFYLRRGSSVPPWAMLLAFSSAFLGLLWAVLAAAVPRSGRSAVTWICIGSSIIVLCIWPLLPKLN